MAAVIKNILLSFLFLSAFTVSIRSSDWPMWGSDEARSFSVDVEIPENLELQWVRQLPEPVRCWPFQYEDYYTSGNPSREGKLSFDVSYEPAASQEMVFIPFMTSDKVASYCLQTGKEIWRFYAGGPVRFAPVYDKNRVYFVSDDGYLYCVKACTGELLWKFKGSYSQRLVLGNERLISIWPARGAPVISGGTVYFASGILPFEGIFIHAVCALEGRRIWTNSASGSLWGLHQHGGAWSYGGPAPQGYLAVSGDRLIVPGGRTPPAVYDKNTGEFLYFRQAHGEVGKGAGGYRVHAAGDWFFNHGMMYSLEDGAQYGPVPSEIITEDAVIGVRRGRVVIAHSTDARKTEVEIKDRLERSAIASKYELERLWIAISERNISRLHFKAGPLLAFSTGENSAGLYRLDKKHKPVEIVWEKDFSGRVWSMLTAGGKLLVVTENGKIYCFGEGKGTSSPVRHALAEKHNVCAGSEALAESIISSVKETGGYAFVFGGKAELAAAIAEKTGIRVVLFRKDSETFSEDKRKLDDAGLYGQQVSILEGCPGKNGAPPYIANLIVLAGNDYGPQEVTKAFKLLRPYGGKLYAAGLRFALPEIAGAVLEEGKDFAVLTREGSLPGSGQWTHQYADAANRNYSEDELVKPPLGTLWFGGPSNLNILPRHYSGPVPQVAGGRIFILGVDTLSARCVYTGRDLWVKNVPGAGRMFTNPELEESFLKGDEVYMTNHPGANVTGSPYVSAEDGIYLIYGDRILVIEPSSGRKRDEISLPALPGLGKKEWGHIMVAGDLLIAGAGPQIFSDASPIEPEAWWNSTSSDILCVLDRHSGKLLWSRAAERGGFRHNAIVSANGKLFAIDGLSEKIVERLRRRGVESPLEPVLFCLDALSGEELWNCSEGVFGTWLGYYAGKEILLEGGRHGGKRNLPDEPFGLLVAREGKSGKILWNRTERYSGALGLHSDMIIPGRPGQKGVEPLSGELISMRHPLTGGKIDWGYHRYYGCGTMNSSTHLITFRSGAAGFYDLAGKGGTANLGGFRSGCTNNLVAADGVLNAPDYTRTCTCSYQLQTSLGFIHVPEAEMWTLNRLPPGRGAVESIGINFGAPGNRRENGVLWLEYPVVYGRGPDGRVKTKASDRNYFRHHSTWIKNPAEGLPWVASYGLEGVESVSVDLVPESAGGVFYYDVYLYFSEPEETASGKRVFSVFLQGDKMLEDFDVFSEAGGKRKTVRAKAGRVRVDDVLTVDFEKNTGSLPAIISGLEIVRTFPPGE